MRVLSPQAQAALEAETVAARDFITFYARNRDTNAEIMDTYWSDLGAFTAEIIDPVTGLTVSRSFEGGGQMLQISAVPVVVGLVVQNVTIQMSQVEGRVQDLIRTYDAKQARVELHRGMLNPISGLLVSPAVPRFSGFIDEVTVNTPKEGEEGSVEIVCVSHTQEMTRSNSATRSDADQRLRSSTDGFFRHVATIGEQTIFWGQDSA